MSIDAPSAFDSGTIAAVGGWLIAFLGLVGGGFKWAVGTRDQRERMINDAVERHVSDLGRRLADAEVQSQNAIDRANRADARSARAEQEKSQVVLILNQVMFAFQLIAADTQRRDPQSPILQQALTVFEQARVMLRAAFPPPHDLTDVEQDLMSELDRKTRGKP